MASKKQAGAVLAARAVAVSRLIAQHDEEFQGYMAAECEARGVKYEAPRSAEDVARHRIESILAKNPALRAEYTRSGLDEFAAAG